MGFAPSTMQLTSTAFAPMGRIPKQYTGEGSDMSPPLAWRGAPPQASTIEAIRLAKPPPA